MLLFIIRHGDAEAHAASDDARALTEKGHKQARKLGKFLRGLDVRLDVVLASPLVRAVETADGILAELGRPAAATRDSRLTCGMTPDEARDLVGEFADAEELALVGHEPDLGRLVAWLCGMRDGGGVEMKKGSCACLDAARFAPGGATLRWLVAPKLLAGGEE